MSNIVLVKKFKGVLDSKSVQERFADILGEGAKPYTNSIMVTVKNNPALLACTPASIIDGALISASMKLSIDPNLGQSALVPYGDKAQFQLMTKGITQLCIRSGMYADMNSSEVYEDEIDSYNPITGKVVLKDVSEFKQRYSGEGKVVGYYAFFELLTGFKKEIYMTKEEVENHGKQFSKSYNRKSSGWQKFFDAMGKKTVLKLLLGKFGIMSFEMQSAYSIDSQADIVPPDQNEDIIKKDKQGSTIIDIEADPVEDEAVVDATIEPTEEEDEVDPEEPSFM